MARFLVTGAAGFIGRHLVRRLAADGHDVVAADRRPWNAPPDVMFHRGDLLEMDMAPLLDGVDYVLHLAGQPGVWQSFSQFRRYSRGNIELTQRLLEAMRGPAPAKFVLASTSAVYGDAPLPATEDGPLRPVSAYGATKLAAEGLCDLYGRTAGVPWLALRYFTVYGPGQRPDMAFSRWLKAVRDGRPLQLFGDGNQARDFTFVAETVAATVGAALTPEACGTAVNVGGGRSVTLREALDAIGHVTGRKVTVEHLPSAPGDMIVTRADTGRLTRLLGAAPCVPLEEGVREQWRWILSGGED